MTIYGLQLNILTYNVYLDGQIKCFVDFPSINKHTSCTESPSVHNVIHSYCLYAGFNMLGGVLKNCGECTLNM